METKTEFKFPPFWIMFISLLTFSLIYGCFSSITTPSISWENFLRCLPAILVAFFVLPITIKLIFNVPALVLTNDCLKNNFREYSIEWSDIAEIQLYKGNYVSGFAKLIINLKNPDEYFNSPVKKVIYKTKQLFLVNDFTIIVDFVAGNNEEIFETIKSYWTRKSEH